MGTDIEEKLKTLSDTQAIAACDALMLLLANRLKETKASRAAETVDATDYEMVLQSAGPAENNLQASLSSHGDSDLEVAGTARAMLLLAADLGYGDLVDSSVSEAKVHVRDMGVVSGVVILAALAVVVGWIPIEERKKISSKRHEGADGTRTEEEVTETYTKRVGVEGVKAFGQWLKKFVPWS